jgi:hypothetical protein
MTITKSNDVMDEDAGGQTPASGSNSGYEKQTVSIPITACPTPPKPGDSLQFKVVSVDANAGTVNAVCEDSREDQAGGSDSLADEFNQEK